MWSGLGASIAAAVRLSFDSHSVAAPEQAEFDSMNVDRIVRSAALFALVLELQRFEEAAITRILDRCVVQESEIQPLQRVEDVQRWLDDLRHRLDLAIARESRS